MLEMVSCGPNNSTQTSDRRYMCRNVRDDVGDEVIACIIAVYGLKIDGHDGFRGLNVGNYCSQCAVTIVFSLFVPQP